MIQKQPLSSLESLIEDSLNKKNYDTLDEFTISYINSSLYTRSEKISFLYSKMTEFDTESVLFSYLLDTLEQLKPLELSIELTDLYGMTDNVDTKNRIINALNYSTLITGEIKDEDIDKYIDHVLHLKKYFHKEILSTDDEKLQGTLIRAFKSTATQNEIDNMLEQLKEKKGPIKKDIENEIALSSGNHEKINKTISSNIKDMSEGKKFNSQMLSDMNSMHDESMLTSNKGALLDYINESKKHVFSAKSNDTTSMTNWIDLNSKLQEKSSSVKAAPFSDISNKNKEFILDIYKNEIENLSNEEIIEIILKVSSSTEQKTSDNSTHQKNDIIRRLELQLDN